MIHFLGKQIFFRLSESTTYYD
uniref:Uncharacterized protein n=1 Tax=Rhizophora mucronata TaxID=61149 RepID=A0A2P2N0V4_RHIMU